MKKQPADFATVGDFGKFYIESTFGMDVNEIRTILYAWRVHAGHSHVYARDLVRVLPKEMLDELFAEVLSINNQDLIAGLNEMKSQGGLDPLGEVLGIEMAIEHIRNKQK